MYKRLFIAFCCFSIYSCAPSHFVKPLEKKQHAANVSFGGPLIKFGTATIPIPFITATYGYGIDSTLTGFASLNVTSALYGNIQLEVGATKQLLKQKHYFPALSFNPVVNFIYHDSKAYKLYPQLDINAFWEYGKKKNFFYIGVDNWFELSSKKAYDLKQQNKWFVSPMIGHTFSGAKWNFNIEAKVIAPHLSNKDIVVEYQTPLKDKGAFGIYFGYTRKF